MDEESGNVSKRCAYKRGLHGSGKTRRHAKAQQRTVLRRQEKLDSLRMAVISEGGDRTVVSESTLERGAKRVTEALGALYSGDLSPRAALDEVYAVLCTDSALSERALLESGVLDVLVCMLRGVLGEVEDALVPAGVDAPFRVLKCIAAVAGEQPCEALHAAGAVPLLVRVVVDEDSGVARADALCALARMVYLSRSIRAELVGFGIEDLALSVLESMDVSTVEQTRCFTILHVLIYNERENHVADSDRIAQAVLRAMDFWTNHLNAVAPMLLQNVWGIARILLVLREDLRAVFLTRVDPRFTVAMLRDTTPTARIATAAACTVCNMFATPDTDAARGVASADPDRAHGLACALATLASDGSAIERTAAWNALVNISLLWPPGMLVDANIAYAVRATLSDTRTTLESRENAVSAVSNMLVADCTLNSLGAMSDAGALAALGNAAAAAAAGAGTQLCNSIVCLCGIVFEAVAAYVEQAAFATDGARHLINRPLAVVLDELPELATADMFAFVSTMHGILEHTATHCDVADSPDTQEVADVAERILEAFYTSTRDEVVVPPEHVFPHSQ